MTLGSFMAAVGWLYLGWHYGCEINKHAVAKERGPMLRAIGLWFLTAILFAVIIARHI